VLVEADLDPDDPDVQLVAVKMRNGSLDGQMSYAFRCGRDSFDEETRTRELHEVSIAKGDVSIVPYGANSSTTSSIRSQGRAVKAPPRADLTANVTSRRQRQERAVKALRKGA
jgi:phage head maturation protease